MSLYRSRRRPTETSALGVPSRSAWNAGDGATVAVDQVPDRDDVPGRVLQAPRGAHVEGALAVLGEGVLVDLVPVRRERARRVLDEQGLRRLGGRLFYGVHDGKSRDAHGGPERHDGAAGGETVLARPGR